MFSDDVRARNAIRVWMRQVLEEKGWTAAEWARAANTSATNITRVLSPGSDIVPSSATVAKLAAAAGSQPNLGAYQRIAGRSVALLQWGHWDLEMPEGRVISPVELSEGAFAVSVDSTAMNAAGIMPGDILICEPPSASWGNLMGETVVGSHDDTPVLGRVLGEWLMPLSSDRHDPLPIGDVQIRGVVVYSMRRVGAGR